MDSAELVAPSVGAAMVIMGAVVLVFMGKWVTVWPGRRDCPDNMRDERRMNAMATMRGGGAVTRVVQAVYFNVWLGY